MARKFSRTFERYPDLTGTRKAEGGRRPKGAVRESHRGLPLVTIVTVCFNSATTIEQTIRSVRDQTYENIEYVVVDGGSSDGTIDILRRNEDLIDYFVSEPDEGLYHAMNKGIELAQGEFILLLNSDDWLVSDAIEALVKAKDYSGSDFVGALARYIDEDKDQSHVLRSMPFDHSVLFRMSLRHETLLVPAELYERVGPLDTDFRIIADRDHCARLFEIGATYYEIPRPLLNFRTSGVSNTDIDRLLREKDQLLQKQFPFLSEAKCAVLNDPKAATAEIFAEAANRHLDQPKFVKACRALLRDRRANEGPRWHSDALETIAADRPDEWPKVSIVLPFFEAAETIASAIDSVLAQTFKAWELLCINDAAIDDSQDIVDTYVQRDPRIRRLRNETNKGLGASRNAGIRAARGWYIFHLDPDDTLPPTALKSLYEAAVAHGSDMVKGAYRAEQGLHGQAAFKETVKYPGGVKDKVVANTTLEETPRLIRTTEGHWSYLYDAVLAERVCYPTDLKMGQDSIFLVKALVEARKITLVPEIVYNYQANAQSAMNRFTERKFFDALEWRRRAWAVLRDAGHVAAADNILFSYWDPDFFVALERARGAEIVGRFWKTLGRVFHDAQFPGMAHVKHAAMYEKFQHAVSMVQSAPCEFAGHDFTPARDELSIATILTQDFGGAGIGSQRRVKALRKAGVDAQIFAAFRESKHDYVDQLPLAQPLAAEAGAKELRSRWREKGVLRRSEHPGLKAREMFSKTGSIVDFRDCKSIFDAADVVHLHWVTGVFDYDRTETLAGVPTVWTLADMNAFTGGCHYSEGCEGYKTDCRNCPLLPADSELAHEQWKVKRKAYANIDNLTIICPSQWLADCVRQSTLLGNRRVEVIPNAFPIDRFKPTNRLAARRKLGLPLDKKLVVFGADSLSNERKGGDLLEKAIKSQKNNASISNLQGIFFGHHNRDLGIPVHEMGHVSDERDMALIYSAADVFAFPSREDNAPLTVAEAMLSGVPVVGFRVGNVADLVRHRDTGYLARREDIVDFGEGLAWVLSDTDSSEALQRRLRAHLHAKEVHDSQKAAQRHIRLYEEVLKTSAAAR